MKFCLFPGCINRHDSYGLCRSHRLQQIKGIELRSIRPVRSPGFYVCTFEGCTHKQNKFGLCSGHQKQSEKGQTLRPLRLMNRKGTGLHPERRKMSVRQAGLRRTERIRNAPGIHTAEQVEARWAYFGHLCVYCGRPATQTDHKIPLSRGGSAWPANLVPACLPCNYTKNDMPYKKWMEKIA